MRNFTSCIGFLCLFLNLSYSQPPNDNCANAINITTLDGTAITYDFNNATPDVANGACAEGNNNTWFTFTAQGTSVDITITGINRPEFTLVQFGTACNAGTATVIVCADLTENYTTITETNVVVVAGTEYTIIATNNNNTNGTLDMAINSPIDLPIELHDFQGTSFSDGNILNWETLSEEGFSHFEIQKSRDGFNWEYLDKINGVGYSTELQSYSYEDRNPFGNDNFYRLKMIDLDGTFEYSFVIAISKKSDEEDLEIYPNPSKGKLILSSSVLKNTENVSLVISDMTNRIVFEQQINNTDFLELDLEYLPKGIYLISIQLKDDILVRKVLLE